MVTRNGITPRYVSKKGQTRLFCLLLCFQASCLSGCITSEKSKPLAPQPPVTSFLVSEQSSADVHDVSSTQQTLYEDDLPTLSGQYAAISADQSVVVADSVNVDDQVTASLVRCKLNKRFDRDALLAYEWDRSRLSVDVDGINMSGGGDRGFYLQYKIRLQPEKPKESKCRYASKWQGMVGSGYNELILRDENTVWSELRNVQKDVKQYIGNVF
ncbi:MAG: hypothetical protein ACRBCK_08330 [Alphaproteobacteria bacterium]